jgi:hypothetical protein
MCYCYDIVKFTHGRVRNITNILKKYMFACTCGKIFVLLLPENYRT